MEVTEEAVRDLLRAVQANSVGVAPPRPLLAKALASVHPTPNSVSADHPGASWIGPDDEFNSLLRDGNRLIHARVKGGRAEAASYGSPVDALEAVDIRESDHAFGALDWFVMTWRITLLDGTVVSIYATDPEHAEKLATFAREHLQPRSTS